MAKCDLCGGDCQLSEMTTLLDSYQVDGVRDICRPCERLTTNYMHQLFGEIAPRMRAAISAHKRQIPPGPMLTRWQRFIHTLREVFSS